MNARIALRIVTVIAALFLFLSVSFLLWKILAPFLISYILFFALKPLVNALEHRGVTHTPAVLIVFFGIFGALVLLLVLIIPSLVGEFSNIKNNLDTYERSFLLFVDRMKIILSGFSVGSSSPGKDYFSRFEGSLNSLAISFAKNLPGILSTIGLYCMVIPFATFFLLLDHRRITKLLIGIVPNRYFEVTLNLFYNLNRQFSLILRGMFISVIIISLLSTIGLWVIGLRFPLIIGFFAGISNLIPYAGPIVGIVAAFASAVMTGSAPGMYISIIIVFVLVQFLDNTLVQPIVLAKSTNLHPLLVLFLVLLGSSFGGVIGMFLIIPVVSLSRVALFIVFAEILRPPRPDFSLYRDIDSASSES